MKVFLLTVFLFLYQQRVAAGNTFYWDWSFAGKGQLKLSGKLDNEKETSIYIDAQKTINRFVVLYTDIETKNHPALSSYLKTVDTLSEELVKPFITSLKKSKAIVLSVDRHLLFSPIEVLMVDSVYLGLFRPVVFQMKNNFIDINADTFRIRKGLILRDSTADTDNNCRNILQKYPGSELKYIHDLREKDFLQKRSIDFLLVSAHGTVDGSSLKGGILFDDTTIINEDFLKKNDPKLIYMDACTQGMNIEYINTLSATKKINYYIGSPIAVDQGDAASRMLNVFFTFFERTHNPVISLWKTKLNVFNNYKDPSMFASVLTTINKSLMFRIYKL